MTIQVGRWIAAAAVTLLTMTMTTTTHAEVALQRLFSEGAVLQANAPIPVYGTAEPGEKVTVRFRAQTVTATAGDNGKWAVHLKPEKASETPGTLTVAGAKNTVTVNGVLVGEVWVCSGQSNMEWVLANATDGPAEAKAASDPLLRMFTVPKLPVATPQEDVAGGSWQSAAPDTAGNFSAVGYYFAKALRESRHVPIGMIHTSWGGTRIQAWMDRGTLLAAGASKDEFRTLPDPNTPQTNPDQEARRRHHDDLQARWKAAGAPLGPFADPGIAANASGYAETTLDDGGWGKIGAPGAWERSGIPELEAMDGAIWFRKTFVVAAADAGKSATLSLGAIDDCDTTFVNGTRVGATGSETPNSWQHPRQYSVPAGVLKEGRNVVAVRVWDNQGDGGLMGPDAAMKLAIDGGSAVPLAGEWLYRTENIRPADPGPYLGFDPNTATVLYNGMIAPLTPYGVTGFLWYQGESNAWEPERYRTFLPAMAGLWRSAFQNPKAPFLIVQLPNYDNNNPKGEDWARFREAQTQASLEMPLAGIAVTIDVGNIADIHPRNKKPVGERLARAARRIAYRENLTLSPLVKYWERETQSLLVTFTDPGKGLMAPKEARGMLTGWEIAGGDGVYHPAVAEIVGKKRDQVRVYSPEVPYPFHVRYDWANSPMGNLYNSDGLPVSPFRTDVPLIPVQGK